jgi:hypothetical protein
MTNLNIAFTADGKVQGGQTAYSVPKAVDGEITLDVTFPASAAGLDKYLHIKSDNERMVVHFGAVSVLSYVLRGMFNLESRIALGFKAGDDTPFETVAIDRN